MTSIYTLASRTHSSFSYRLLLAHFDSNVIHVVHNTMLLAGLVGQTNHLNIYLLVSNRGEVVDSKPSVLWVVEWKLPHWRTLRPIDSCFSLSMSLTKVRLLDVVSSLVSLMQPMGQHRFRADVQRIWRCSSAGLFRIDGLVRSNFSPILNLYFEQLVDGFFVIKGIHDCEVDDLPQVDNICFHCVLL